VESCRGYVAGACGVGRGGDPCSRVCVQALASLKKRRRRPWPCAAAPAQDGGAGPAFVEPEFQVQKLVSKVGWLRSPVRYSLLGVEVWRTSERRYYSLRWVRLGGAEAARCAVLCAHAGEDMTGVPEVFPLQACTVAARPDGVPGAALPHVLLLQPRAAHGEPQAQVCASACLHACAWCGRSP
jgi:hypothetical protein